MKMAIVSIGLVLTAMSAQATEYQCNLKSLQSKKAVSFTLDTVTENNKTVDLGKGSSVGCVVFRSTPQLITCGLSGETFSIFSTAEDGSSVLALSMKSGKFDSSLLCKKAK